VYVDFYNLHPNAQDTDADLAARRSNITQISNYIAANSVGNAVVVMGDTNTRYTRTGDNIRDLVNPNRLTDVWVSYILGGTPPAIGSPALVCDPANVNNSCEVVDKILFRGNRFINLNLIWYNNENASFLDANGAPLSDHYPHTARFSWTLNSNLRMSDQFGGPHGAFYTDVDKVSFTARPSTVSIRAGARVDQVGLTLNNGTQLVHGGTGGTAQSLTLGSSEYLTQATMSQGEKDGRTRIFYIQFRTNLGRTLTGGTVTGSSVTYTAPAGWQISGFHGRAGDEVDKLGFIYTPRN
ncbi:MAG TPA: jacalin-like lectin, partial [Blastocatellia bacterium]|nr:jacalin-like lectin [Blastocatellia bacterium]